MQGPAFNIRLLREDELVAADEILREALRSQLGIHAQEPFMKDAMFARSRWCSQPTGSFAAEISGTIVGSNFAIRRGSFGFLGPLTVKPSASRLGIGKRLLEEAISSFDSGNVKHVGVFTFANSQAHVGLYQSFGFWPRFLTAIMAVPVSKRGMVSNRSVSFSTTPPDHWPHLLQRCRQITHAIYEGLDVSGEIRAAALYGLGETVLLMADEQLAGFAICHFGPGTEAGAGRCYIKFAATRPSDLAATEFLGLLDACEGVARSHNLDVLVGGTNFARKETYELMRKRGFITTTLGVAMQRPNEEGYNRAGVYVIDDWR